MNRNGSYGSAGLNVDLGPFAFPFVRLREGGFGPFAVLIAVLTKVRRFDLGVILWVVFLEFWVHDGRMV